MQQVTIIDAPTGRRITGKLIKRYPLGLTIDDDRDIRYYAIMERVLTPLASETITVPGEQSSLLERHSNEHV